MGTPFSQEINDFVPESSLAEVQLIPGIVKNEFTMTIPNDYVGWADVSKVSFQIQDNVSTNGVIAQQTGTITPVSEASNPNYGEDSYLEIDRADNKITKIIDVADGSEIIVDGIKKYDSYPCNNFRVFHPSGNKNELKIVVDDNSSSEVCGDVYRVQLDANDYCAEKVLDSQESNKAPCIISAPETKDLVAVEAYKNLLARHTPIFS